MILHSSKKRGKLKFQNHHETLENINLIQLDIASAEWEN